MRNIINFFMLLGVMVTGQAIQAQDFERDKMSTRLLEAVEMRSADRHDVYIVLDEQIDIDRMEAKFNAEGLPYPERAKIINRTLRAIADATQPPVIEDVMAVGVQNITPIWIVNALFFNASSQQIKDISRFDAIKFLDLDTELVIEEPEPGELDGGRSEGGSREPGLDVIKAPFMWNMGYTGYGMKAFVMDTGVDLDHPALHRNYAGHAIPEDQAWFGPLDRNNRPFDCQNHGSHCTGTVLGIDRIRQDTIGVAYNAMWTGAPILLVCDGNTAIRMAGFQWAMDPDNNPETTDDMPDVINNSWTDTMVEDCYEVYEQLLTTVEASGIAVVFAAGNDGPNPETISRPKNINKSLVNTFAVAAVRWDNLDIADFSSRGPSRCESDEHSLQIKPEVSAPGVNVRSSVPTNDYASFNGTSMAAPHAAGAILLLKEAFPYLSGIDIKLALYHSATDLGDPGEDNIYGMGLIDLESAFQYLLDQGHEPVDPRVNHDLSIEHFSFGIDYCEGQVNALISFKNEGEMPINGFSLQAFYNEFADEADLIFNFPQSIAPGELLDTLVSLPLDEDGRYNIVLRAEMDGIIDEKPLNNSIRANFGFGRLDDWTLNLNEDIQDGVLCGGSELVLSQEGENTVLLLYDNEDDEEPAYAGNFISLPVANADTTYRFFAGFGVDKPIFSRSTSLSSYDFFPEVFSGVTLETAQEVTIESLKFEAKERIFPIIQIQDDEDNLLWTYNRVEQAGENIIPVGVTLPAGRVYRIVIRGNRDIVAHNYDDSGHQFDGYFRILHTEINENIDEEGFSTPIYDLNISYVNQCSRKPLSFDVRSADQVPQAKFELLDEESAVFTEQAVEFINGSEDAIAFEWDMGDGSILYDEFPVHTYQTPGQYTVTLKAIDEEGCFGMFARVLDVLEDSSTSVRPDLSTGLSDMTIYPNPANAEIHLLFSDADVELDYVEVIRIDGQVIRTNSFSGAQQDYIIDLSSHGLVSGMYVVRAVLRNGEMHYDKVVVK